MRCKFGIRPRASAASRYSSAEPSRQITTMGRGGGWYRRWLTTNGFVAGSGMASLAGPGLQARRAGTQLILRQRSPRPPARRRQRARSFHCDVHGGEGFRDHRQQGTDVRFKQASDRSDAEKVDLTDLAWINDESSLAEPPIEVLEAEIRHVGKVERSDDIALNLWPKKRAKPDPFHPLDEHLVVAPVARGTAGDAALLLQFLQSLGKGQQGMSGRGVAELAVLFEPIPLAEQVETQAAGITLAGQQRRAAAEDERKTRHAFDAFVGGGDEIIDSGFT